jgi:diaminopimelate decarboxylase
MVKLHEIPVTSACENIHKSLLDARRPAPLSAPRHALGGPVSGWPLTAEPALSVGGVSLAAIAEKNGTPAYVVDEEHVRARCREYLKAEGLDEVAYAAEAFWCRAMARWIAEEGLSLGAGSEGQLVVAGAVGFPAGRILMHGNGRTLGELSSAIDHGISRFVIDSTNEIAQLAALGDRPRQVLLRVTPGIDAHLGNGTAPGDEDEQFGFSTVSAAAAAAAQRIRALPSLELAGLYCDLGSQGTSIGHYETAARRLVAFMAKLGGLPELNLGSGQTAPCQSEDQGLDVTEFGRRISGVVRRACSAYSIPVPRLTVEPGRAIVGQAGLTLYRVLTVKRGPRMLVVVDGGMNDSERPAPHGDRRHIERVGSPTSAPAEPATVVGRHCRAGDVLVPDALLPGDIRPGDLLAVPCTGAYHHARASNYNQVARPPVIAVRDGRARPVIRRETDEDVLRRDVG